MRSEKNSHFVVTSLSKNQSRILGSQIWDTSEPLTFGTPIQWILEKTDTGVQVRPIHFSLASPDESKVAQFTFGELDTAALISLSHVRLKLHPIRRLSTEELSDGAGWIPRPVQIEDLPQDEVEQKFKKTLGGAFVGLMIFWLLCFLWPKPEKAEELIPPQFAKILLTPTARGNVSTPQKDSSGGRHEGVVQAMQSKAVKATARKLVSSSRLALLAKSTLLGGLTGDSKVSRMFESHKQATLSSALLSNSAQTSIAPTTLGGSKSSGEVGYGKGQKANINSQGKATVSFDASEAIVEEGLTLDEVGRVIHAHMKEVRYCYESAIVRDPSLEGKMLVNFKIEPTGRVKRGSANARDSKVSDSGLERCILSRLESWKFPQPKGGVQVEVSYPFVFQVLQ